MTDLAPLALESDPSLLNLVRPTGWVNPTPQPIYDLVVAGGGAAGLVCAFGAAGIGARVALVEKDRLGGDCLNTGCVPSKALLHAAGLVQGIASTERLESARLDFREKRANLARHDSAKRLAAAGIDLFFGEARFTSPGSIQVGEALLRFRKAALCVGASPLLPNIPGLGEIHPLTTDSFFDQDRLPVSLVILGGGPVGCELAQAMSRLGCKVTLLEKGPEVLPRENRLARQLVGTALIRDGVCIRANTQLIRVEKAAVGARLHLKEGDGLSVIEAEALLVATGRRPNIHGLGLDQAGIRQEDSFLKVDRFLRTTNGNVYAAGDVLGPPYLTHRSGAHAKVVIQNSLFWHPLGLGMARADRLLIPRCLHTDPAVAQVGITSEEAIQKGISHITFSVNNSDQDRMVLENEGNGLLELVLAKGTGKLLGATVIGKLAGELILPAIQMMQQGKGLESLNGLILPYPTRMEIWTRAAQQFRAARFQQSAWQQWLVRWLTGMGK